MIKRIATVFALSLLLAGCVYSGPSYGYYGPGYYSSGWGSYPGPNSRERTASPGGVFGG